MRVVDLIQAKKTGGEWTRDQVRFLVSGSMSNEVPEYQLAAILMAVCWRGLSLRETVYLTDAMARSGDMLDLSFLPVRAVDKHSTGGVGDKTSLVVCPWVAACGVPVAKMSGRALGFTGGTVDKLESIPGVHADLSRQQFLDQLAEIGVVVASQSATLAPADRVWYSLRDRTATVDCMPLIASSILSKKIAAGASAIVIDVKVGSGAFARTLTQATELAQLLTEVGLALGRDVRCVLTSMEQPLGRAIGNILEVKEAITALSGDGPPDLMEVSMRLGREMLLASGKQLDPQKAEENLGARLRDGAALHKLAELISAQGGNGAVVTANPEVLGEAKHSRPLTATRSGYVTRIDAARLGWAARSLASSLETQAKDPTAGFVLNAKAGDSVGAGEALLQAHCDRLEALDAALKQAGEAYTIADQQAASPPLLLQII